MAFKIYTAGKMSGISFGQQMDWRNKVERELLKLTDEPVKFIHPPLYFNYECDLHKTEAEIKTWELNQIRDCDIVVANLNGIDSTIGTHFELGFVDAVNTFGNKHIYVVGIGDGKNLHPWIELSMLRIEPTIEAACSYISEYLLI